MDDEEQDRNNVQNPGNRQEQNAGNNIVVHHNCIAPWTKELEGVTTLYRCKASDAKVLYIFDIADKLQLNDQYDIGGAYTDTDMGFWFFFTTSSGLGDNFLMNIFVYQKKPGMLSLGISDSNTLTTAIYNNNKVISLSQELSWLKFVCTPPDNVKYIKTFCFSEEDRVSLLKMVLVIPISIEVNPTTMMVKDIVQKIKMETEFGEKLLKDQEPDFVLKSGEGKEFKVHKIILAAHSPKIRDLIRPKDCKTLSLDFTDHEIELLLQYLYTGTIKDIINQQYQILFVMADTFDLKNLTELVKRAIKLSINSDNVMDIAIMAEKHNYKDIQDLAFSYIANHPEVIVSDAFSKIDNANIVKKLLRYIYKASHRDDIQI